MVEIKVSKEALRFFGNANNNACSPRFLYSHYAVSNANWNNGGFAQFSIKLTLEILPRRGKNIRHVIRINIIIYFNGIL